MPRRPLPLLHVGLTHATIVNMPDGCSKSQPFGISEMRTECLPRRYRAVARPSRGAPTGRLSNVEGMALDPRQPVLVGAAQLIQRPADLHDAHEAVALMGEAGAGAARDSGSPDVAGRADLVVAVKGAWRYSDPARLVA